MPVKLNANLENSFGRVMSFGLAACLFIASQLVSGAGALAAPSVCKLTGTLQAIVIQSVTNSINSCAFVGEQEIQTANDGSIIESDETAKPDADADIPVEEQKDASTDALHPGSKGEPVKALQRRLMQLQFFDDDEATGQYGAETSEAVKLFQRTNSLPIDGIAGTATLKLLYSDKALKYTVKRGDSGTDVASLQRRLKALKYFSGSATGYFGASTLSAVKEFQKRNGLSADGKVGSRTRDLLYSSKAKVKTTSTSSKPASTPSPTPTPAPAPGKPTSASAFLTFAQAQLGKRYVRGNEGPTSFDCSGFVYYCLTQNGVKIGRLSASGFSGVGSWVAVNKSDLKPGDLLFFGLHGSASVGHTGIYLGNNRMIHASSSKGKVVIADINGSYWVENYKSARRVF
jgi:cell wall-associated NlpC family hydrolase